MLHKRIKAGLPGGSPPFRIGGRMKNTVDECTRALLEAIRESKEYKDFERCKAIMEGQDEARARADAFRKKVYLMQDSNCSIDRLDEMARLSRERQELRKDKMVSEYLATELALCRMLQRISLQILNVTDIQLEALEDAIEL